MILHVWLAFVRLRAIEGDGARLSDYLFSNFWTDAERRIAADVRLLTNTRKDGLKNNKRPLCTKPIQSIH
jgi:hypothetical protein